MIKVRLLLLVTLMSLVLAACGGDSGSSGSNYIPPTVVNVESVSVYPNSLNINAGDNRTLTATVLPTNATVQSVVYSSNDDGIAKVNQTTGVVTGVSNGSAIITATTVDGGFTAMVSVTVNPAGTPTVAVTGVTASIDKTTIKANETAQVSATVSPPNATNNSVTYSSSDDRIAKVNPTTGLVTGVSGGNAIITATTVDGGFKATASVTITGVYNAVTSVELNYSSLTIATDDMSVQLIADVKPSNATDTSVTFSSDNISVIQVDENGGLTPKAVGMATITAKAADNKIDNVTVNVVAPVCVSFPAGYDNVSGTWQIYNAKGLEAFRDEVNGGGVLIPAKLMCNILLDNTTEWTPIGNDSLYYEATFDGDNHTISGLHINNSLNNQGLFGTTSSSSFIQNLGVINAHVTGNDNVGAIVGQSYGLILSTYVNNSTITSNGDYYANVGGIAGQSHSLILSTYVKNSTITSNGDSYANVGGIAGSSRGRISVTHVDNSTITSNGDTYASVGGIAGQSYSEILATYVKNSKISSIDQESNVGGAVGFDVGKTLGVYVNNSTVSSTGTLANVGGVIGLASSRPEFSYFISIDASLFGIGNDNRRGSESNNRGAMRVESLQAVVDNLSFMNGSLPDDTEYYYELGDATKFVSASSISKPIGIRVYRKEIIMNTSDNRTNVVSFVPSKADQSTTSDFTTSVAGLSFNNGTITSGTSTGNTTINIESTANSNLKVAIDVTVEDTGYRIGADNGIWQIYNEKGLKIFGKHVNEYEESEISVKLLNDIVIREKINDTDNWEPVAPYADIPYTGEFNGDNHTISGLDINSSMSNLGLFATVGYGGIVKNIVIVDAYISGRSSVGGIVGVNAGLILSAYVKNSYINASSESAGGIAGTNTADASIIATYVDADSNVQSGHDAGGIVGHNSGGIIIASYDNSRNGIVGTNNGGTITASYYKNDVEIGEGENVGIRVDNIEGLNNNVDNMNNAVRLGRAVFVQGSDVRNDAPTLKFMPSHEVVSSEWQIYDNDGLIEFEKHVNDGNPSTHAKLMRNVLFNTNLMADWKPIGDYTGIFDGNGYTISNIRIVNSKTNNLGLFGNVEAGATVKNLGLINTVIDAPNSDNVGSIAAVNQGSIIATYAYSNNGMHTYVVGNKNVGAIVGVNSGTVTASYSTGKAESITNTNHGGIVGVNSGGTTIENYYISRYDIGESIPGVTRVNNIAELNNVVGIMNGKIGAGASYEYIAGGDDSTYPSLEAKP